MLLFFAAAEGCHYATLFSPMPVPPMLSPRHYDAYCHATPFRFSLSAAFAAPLIFSLSLFAAFASLFFAIFRHYASAAALRHYAAARHAVASRHAIDAFASFVRCHVIVTLPCPLF
jgi:hypothetical protein